MLHLLHLQAWFASGMLPRNIELLYVASGLILIWHSAVLAGGSHTTKIPTRMIDPWSSQGSCFVLLL